MQRKCSYQWRGYREGCAEKQLPAVSAQCLDTMMYEHKAATNVNEGDREMLLSDKMEPIAGVARSSRSKLSVRVQPHPEWAVKQHEVLRLV